MLERHLPPPPSCPLLHSKFGALKNGVPKYVPQDALIEAFETAQAETTARIRAGLSLPASPEGKSTTSRSWPHRRHGSEPPPSPSRRQRLLGLELPQPPLPPVAGELKVRLEALELEAKRSHAQELERMREICNGLQEDLELCRRSLDEKGRQEEMAQKELARLRAEHDRAEAEKARQQRSESKETLRLKEALSLLEQSEQDKSRRLQMEQEEVARLQTERDRVEAELRDLQMESLRSAELKEKQLRERMETEKRQELLQKQKELQRLEADVRRLTESVERAEEEKRHLRKALQERERVEAELRDSLSNLKGRVMAQKQQEILGTMLPCHVRRAGRNDVRQLVG
ncbi:unnamed protein product [Durusdinium trenchii]|uniref:Uncharacterized protein n=1 Tax=Durusdinium trenchii TaxID=1381693 RepID=A0ABP0ISK0_9DINO